MNEFIKNYAKACKVKLWQVAEALGMHDSNFSKMLRHQLTPEEEHRIFEIIDHISVSDTPKKENKYE